MRTTIIIMLTAASGLVSGLKAVPSAYGQDQPPVFAASAPIGLLEAVQSTLALHPLLQVQQKQVDISRALRQQRSADFDTQLQWTATHGRSNTPLIDAERSSAALAGGSTAALTENTLAVTGVAQRLLRSGMVIGPSVVMDRTTDNMQNLDGLNRARLSFDVNMPLLRGKGRAIVTAPETAAQIGVEASLYDLNQEIADLVLSTAAGYWQYVASLTQLEIITASEVRGREFVDSIATLVQADKLPRSEIYQAQANVAGRASSLVAIEQQVMEARSNLALAMGLAPEQLAQLPMPSDAFPDGVNQTPPSLSPESLRALIGLALTRRADYLAAGKRREAAGILRRSAGDRLRPQLDLTMSGGYSGLRGGRRPGEFLAAPFTHASGPDAVVGLRYSLPLANNLALGQVAEAEASYQQARLLSVELARVIANSVVNSLTAVYNGMLRLDKAHEAVAGYQAALEGEKDKLRLGVGSITDILIVEGRLTEALLDFVSAQQGYAVGLAQLRFASGTLVAPDNAVQSVDREVFFRPPPQAYGRP